MTNAASPPAFRISLREFFALVSAAAIACAALKYANEYWLAAVSLLTLLAFMAMAIVAAIDRGVRQASALGFVLAGATYGALLYSSDLALHDENLPTTRLMHPLYGLVVETWYYDRATGRMIRESELPPGAIIDGVGFKASAPKTGFSFGNRIPDLKHFMRIAHCLWALLFGYVGGHFARWVYARRLREQLAPQ